MKKKLHRKRNRKPNRAAKAAERRPRPANAGSEPAPQTRLQWREPQAAEISTLEALDSHAWLRNALRQISSERDEWAGLPMPLDNQQLIVEPTFPNADKLMEIGAASNCDRDTHTDARIRNTFWSWRWRSDIVIWEEGGKLDWGKVPSSHGFGHTLQTLGASDAWGIEQEQRALQTLGELVRHRAFKQYLLTGMFLETSQRSGVTYMFRRLKPTVAISMRGEHPKILCALCLHPIAYYEGSWAGAMCPTDDVIAHLMLMRGDEPMFWKRANQHAPYRKEAGL